MNLFEFIAEALLPSTTDLVDVKIKEQKTKEAMKKKTVNPTRDLWRAVYRDVRLDRGRKLLKKTFEKISELFEWGTRPCTPQDQMEKVKTFITRLKKSGPMISGRYGEKRVKALRKFAKKCRPPKKAVPMIGICPVMERPYLTKDSRYISTGGLGEMVKEGCDFFEEAVGEVVFPHNFIFSAMSSQLWIGPCPFRYKGRYVSAEGADFLLRSYGRIRNWLKSAVDLPALSKVILTTQSLLGLNSDRTTLNLSRFMERFPSPGAAERKLWKVRRRAEAILSAYEGDYRPSWNDIAHAISAAESVGKAAIIAVAETIRHEEWGQDGFQNYADARDYLVSIRTAAFPVADNSDGVEARREAEPRLKKLGMSVYRIRVTEKYGCFSLKWLVRTDAGRTFHVEGHVSCPTEALKWAIRAWKRQDELEAENANLVSFLDGNELGFCPLITRQDSYSAGNCEAGTESWLRDQGWEDRRFFGAPVLLPHLGDPRVVRVVEAARQRFIV